jgi:hypothetical protein
MGMFADSFVPLLPEGRQSETDSAAAGCREFNQLGGPKSLQLVAFRPAEGYYGPPRPVPTPPTPPGGRAKNRCDPNQARRLAKSPIALVAGSSDLYRKGGVGAVDDHEEGENPTSRQAFSGRSAGTVGRVPEASNGTASPQSGVAGSQRPNQFSACQSREQRYTGPRTPLHVNEGRPRARYDKKESNRCSQVEVDSC